MSRYPPQVMRAEFFRPDQPDHVVGTATWEGRSSTIEAEDDAVRTTLERIFRASSVVVEDSALRPAGSSGETVVEPGDLEWFRSAASIRGEREGLSVRFASDAPGGWEPAGAYRTFRGWIGRKELPGTPSG